MENLSSYLQYIYTQVNDMLKFAEAKNAGLIVLNLTTIIALLQVKLPEDSIIYLWGIRYIIVLNFCSIFFCLVGIYAQLRAFEQKPSLDGSENLLYFGDIALMSADEFYNRVKKKYQIQSANESFDIDMCRQIVIVSQITVRKFRTFNIAMFFTIASIPPTVLCYWIFKQFFDPNR